MWIAFTSHLVLQKATLNVKIGPNVTCEQALWFFLHNRIIKILSPDVPLNSWLWETVEPKSYSKYSKYEILTPAVRNSIDSL